MLYMCDNDKCFYYETILDCPGYPPGVCPSCKQQGVPYCYRSGVLFTNYEGMLLGVDASKEEIIKWEDVHEETPDAVNTMRKK